MGSGYALTNVYQAKIGRIIRLGSQLLEEILFTIDTHQACLALSLKSL